jgi:hypothetical protein
MPHTTTKGLLFHRQCCKKRTSPGRIGPKDGKKMVDNADLYWLLGTSIDKFVHTMSSRVTQVPSGVYLCFKQPNDDKEDYEISVSGVKLLSWSFRHVNAGFLPSKL